MTKGTFSYRARLLLDALEHPSSPDVRTNDHLIDQLAARLGSESTPRDSWLTLAILDAVLPTSSRVREVHNSLMLGGAREYLAEMAQHLESRRTRHIHIELLRDSTLVDVRHTAETELATGIQRVARETVKRWSEHQQILLVTWTLSGGCLRRLSQAEKSTALFGTPIVRKDDRALRNRIVIPLNGTYILPELAAEMWRTERLGALAEFSGIATGVIGFDCVPLTSGETVAEGMPGAFARNLSAVARMDRIATISAAAATEYRGWRSMLSATGINGPDIRSVSLASSIPSATDKDVAAFVRDYHLGDVPLVVVVGSHEPRKNHSAVLEACERIWRAGTEFNLIFVGGNSWNSEAFRRRIIQLRERGRSVQTVSAISDELLGAAYRTARFTIFPSLNEGFGLPVAESLEAGTPVITSNFGSMREIAEAGGALLVDPRDDESIETAIATLLSDDEVFDRLTMEARAFRPKSWDAYADELWDYLVDSGTTA